MAAPIRQSSLVLQSNIAAVDVTGATINGVASGNCLTAIVVAHRPSSATTSLCTGYGTTISGVAANTWTNVLRIGRLDQDGVWYSEITAWVAPNSAAGDTVGKPTFGFTNALTVYTHMDEWTGIVTSSPVDRTSTITDVGTTNPLTVGPTSTLTEASQTVIAVVANRYNYHWNNGYSSGGNAPSGYTLVRGNVDNTNGNVAQTVYKDVAATTGVSAAWSYVENYGPVVAALFTLRQGSSTLRLEVDNIDTEITGTTGWTFWAWSGDPLDAAAAKRWTSYDASLSGGKLIFPDAPSGAAGGSTWNVMGYQPNGTLTTGFMVGTVRAA